MFSNTVVGLLAAIGLGTFVYTKVSRSTGGNTKNALVVAGFAGLFAFIVVLILLESLFA